MPPRIAAAISITASSAALFSQRYSSGLPVFSAMATNSPISPWSVESGISLTMTHTPSMFGNASATRVMVARSSKVLSLGSPVSRSKTLMQVMPGRNTVLPSRISR